MRIGRGLAVFCTALLLQAFLLYRAFHDGPMAGLIPWDDCLTVLRGLHNLAVLERAASPFDLIARLGDVVIHSPISDLQALLGLMVGGGAPWAPFALNGLALLLALYAILFRPGRAPGAVVAALAVFIMVQPVTLNALTFLKADWKGGLLIAAALFVLHQAAEQGRRGLKLFGAAILGLGVAAKLTAFYMPLFAAAALLGFEALAYLARRQSPAPREGGFWLHLRRQRPTLSLCLALAIGPFLAFFLLGALGHHQLIGYIAYAIGDTWSDGMNPVQRAAFYGPFPPGGGGAWGHLHWFALVFVIGALAVSIRKANRLYPACLGLLAALAGLLLVPLVVARTSNWEFGAGLLGVAMAATLISMAVLARHLPRFGPAVVLALTLALSATTPILLAPFDPEVGKPTLAELRRFKAVYGEIEAEIARQAPRPAPTVRVFYENGFAPFPDLSILHFRRTGELMDIDRIDDIGRSDPADLATADFLLTSVPAGPARMRGLAKRFPTSADPAGADRFVAGRADFVPVRRFALADGEIRLYQRRPTTQRP